MFWTLATPLSCHAIDSVRCVTAHPLCKLAGFASLLFPGIATVY